MDSYRGRYILLNVWGEWCSPCLAEIPALVETYDALAPDMLQMVGLLQTSDVKSAQEVMQQQGMSWPQVMLTDELKDFFNIWRYPTNILIHPDGETYLEAGMVNERFFRTHVTY